MTTVVVSEKGQITLPVEMRRKLGLAAQSRLHVQICGKGILLEPVTTVAELAGILSEHAVHGMTWARERDEMERAVAGEAADRG